MELLIEILANILLVIGFYLFQWCVRHKEAAKAILVAIIIIALMVLDVFVIMKYVR
jgi:hypothetical protein